MMRLLRAKNTSRERGQRAELMARQWLEQQGLVHLDSNWHCRLGEIDLIMRTADCLVFIEVRFRKTPNFGGAVASVTRSKQRKLAAAAGIWLSRQRTPPDACRFDVLGMEPDASGTLQYQWIQNAFTGDDR